MNDAWEFFFTYPYPVILAAFGLLTVLVARFPLWRDTAFVTGPGARWIGLLLIIPLPLTVLAGPKPADWLGVRAKAPEVVRELIGDEEKERKWIETLREAAGANPPQYDRARAVVGEMDEAELWQTSSKNRAAAIEAARKQGRPIKDISEAAIGDIEKHGQRLRDSRETIRRIGQERRLRTVGRSIVLASVILAIVLGYLLKQRPAL